jgi:hypothetical protein
LLTETELQKDTHHSFVELIWYRGIF